jgi:hypothetical protein
MANPYDINPYNVASSTPVPTPPPPAPAPAKSFDATPLGIGVNTVKNLALGLFPSMLPADENPYIQTTKDIFQGFARAVGSAGLSITRPFRENTIDGRDTLAASDVSQNPTFQKLWQGVFGTSPIPELATSVADMERSIKGSSFAKQTGLDQHALPLAFAGVLGSESLNFVPFGGTEEGAVRALARETDPAAISVMLGKMGIDPAVAAKAADHLAQTSDPTEIKATLSTLEGVQATQGAAAPKRTPEEIQQIVTDLTKKSGGEITTADKLSAKASPPSPPLAEAAQKAPFEEPLRGEGSVKSPAEAAAAYKAKFIDEPNANGGLVEISGDEIKKLNGGDYAPERSSLYSKEAYNLVKDEIAQGPKKDIVFLGGGSGSGKSELIGQDLKDSGFTGLLYDNSLSNYSGTKRLLDLAKENGKNVEIHAILPDLDRARFFTMLRAAETGRPVTDADFARSHAGFVETLTKLLENGDIAPENVHLFDTRGAEVQIPTDVLATLKSARYTEADILKNHGEETVAAKYENIPPPERLRSLKNARQEAQPEDRLPQKERPADALQGVERGANKEISGSPPTPQERGKAAGEGLESEWKQAGFATKKEYEAALRDIASYGESDKSDAVRRIIAGKLPMKPSPSTASEWKAIFGKRYYSIFKKNAGSAPDDMAAQLGYESEHELLHDVADEVYRRYNEKPTRAAAAPKGAMRTLTEAIRKPDEVLPPRPMDAKPVPPEDDGLVPRGTTVGEGIQAERPVEDGTPKVIRDQLPPSVGDVIANGKSYAAEQTPAHAMQEIAQGADGKSWQSLVRGYMYNFSKEKKAHIFDYLATPEFVLEKLGLGKGAEMLQDAKDAYRNTLKKEFQTIADWQARVKGDPHAKQIIFQYLDGREKDMVREMSPEEHAVAREIRGYLQDWAYRLNLPEDSQLSRYITHIFERDLTGPTESQFVDPELSAIMSENVAKSVYDPFLQKRLGKPGYVEDVWRALDAYVKRAARKEAMDPALERIATMAKDLDTTTYNYVRIFRTASTCGRRKLKRRWTASSSKFPGWADDSRTGRSRFCRAKCAASFIAARLASTFLRHCGTSRKAQTRMQNSAKNTPWWAIRNSLPKWRHAISRSFRIRIS